MIVHLFSLVWFSRERWSLARHVFSKNIKKFRTENTENTEKRWASGSEHRRSARILGTPWERRTEVRHVFFPEKPYPAFPLCAPCEPIFFLSKHANLKVGVPRRHAELKFGVPRKLSSVPSVGSARNPFFSLVKPHANLKIGVPRKSPIG